MNVLFLNSHYYLPQTHGGIANTIHQLATGLMELGHNPSVLNSLRNDGDAFTLKARIKIKANRALRGVDACRDDAFAYPVWRSWDIMASLEGVIRQARPDIIVVVGGKIVPVTNAARAFGIPIVTQVHDVEFQWHGGDFASIVDLPCVANSHFTARAYQSAFGLDACVIYPFIQLEQYRVAERGEKVVFINPLKRKGLRKAIDIARALPNIDFLFVGGIEPSESGQECAQTAVSQLPNVEVAPFRSDMKSVYAQCKVLLVPSQWEETYGRVINEAQVSGIPALASNIGGLPEAVDEGGVLLDPQADTRVWARELETMMSDEDHYDVLSRRALQSVGRPKLQAEHQLKEHENLLLAAIR
ncbi:MAG: glycosyltransferase [Pseudomonadota bacterium]